MEYTLNEILSMIALVLSVAGLLLAIFGKVTPRQSQLREQKHWEDKLKKWK